MELLVDIQKKLSGFELKVDFAVNRDILGLLGASGSGKSMTLRCIAGIETPDHGRIVLNGRILFDSEKGINIPCRKRKLGYLFQNYALFPHMTVEENISFAIGNKKRADRKTIVQEMVTMIRLEGLEKRYPSQLSGGQQQRVALARALAIRPDALLLDEPFSALDDYLRGHMLQQLIETLSRYQGSALFVSHNMEEVYSLCNKLVVLSNGKIEAKGGKEEVFKAPPSLIAAQLTGCENFSPVQYKAPFELEALDWHINLKTRLEISKQVKYVGIRAHTIDEASGDEENVFNCWLRSTSETLSQIIVYLSPEENDRFQGYSQIQWQISKQKWLTVKDKPQPWKLCVKPEELIII